MNEKRPTMQTLRRKPSMQVLPASEAAVVPEGNGDGPAKEKALSLRLPVDTWRRLHMRRLDEGRSVTAIIRQAIDEYLERKGGLKS